jgi:hypothetical protein
VKRKRKRTSVEWFYRIGVPVKDELGEVVGRGYVAWGGFALPPPWQPAIAYAGVYDTTGVRLAGIPLSAPVTLTAHGAVTVPKPVTADELDALNVILKAALRFEPDAKLVLVKVCRYKKRRYPRILPLDHALALDERFDAYKAAEKAAEEAGVAPDYAAALQVANVAEAVEP